ncbi:MAG: FtsX-like permease family protein [Bacteroidota bacterium]
MSTFNYEAAVAAWRKALVARGGSDAAFLAELEASLHDRYEANLLAGLGPAEAFDSARDKVGASPVLAVAEHRKAERRGSALAFLLPSYLKTGLRTLRSRPTYNLTNYLCLVVGIVTAALAISYLNYEGSYDADVPNVNNKYRLGMNLRSQGYSMLSYEDYYSSGRVMQLGMTEALTAIPGIEAAPQFQTFPEAQLVELNNRKLETEQILHTITPAQLADFFGWKFFAGRAIDFAAAPNVAALTEREAQRFFGPDWDAEAVIGQQLRIDTTDYTVAGVVANPPPNSHFDFSIALYRDVIGYWGPRIYVEAGASETVASLTSKINENFAGLNARLAEDELFGGVIVQPLRDVHLNSDLLYELKPPGKPAYLYIIGLIALLVLLLTISNYTNLSVAMSSGRSREIGMRKVFGATDGHIAGQFLLEAVMLSLLAIPAVVVILSFLLPRFDALMGTAIAESGMVNTQLWWVISGCTLGVGLLAGLYPAMFLARKRILELFHRKLSSARQRRLPLRKVIIVGQFVLLIGLCSLTLFVNRQLRYMQDKDLGYQKENILYVNVNADSARFSTFRNEVLNLPEVTAVGAGDPMGQQPYNQLTYKLSGREEVFDDANNIYLDYQSLAMMGIETSIPEYVNTPESAPRQLVLINQTLADRLKNRYGLKPEELVGQILLQEPEYVDAETGQVGFPYEIAGTFQDVNMFSLRERVDPMFMTVTRDPRFVYWAGIRYAGDSQADILARVREVYDRVELAPVFTHAFLEDNLTELYEEESRIATLSTYFSLVAFLTAVIGLIALTAFLTAVRRREIGIRRILGAGTLDILARYNAEYLWPLAAALIIAVPLTILVVNNWLSTFAYRISLGPGVFLVAALLTLVITVLAVSVVTVRAARAVPAGVLGENG